MGSVLQFAVTSLAQARAGRPEIVDDSAPTPAIPGTPPLSEAENRQG